MKNATMQQVKEALRTRYAWPGGYAYLLLMSDGESLCIDCARQNFKQIAHATRLVDIHSGWHAAAVDINWEDSQLYCAHCNAQLLPEYPAD